MGGWSRDQGVWSKRQRGRGADTWSRHVENMDGKREGNVLVCEGVEVEGIRERDGLGEENNSVQETVTGRIHGRACKGRGTEHKDGEKGSRHS